MNTIITIALIILLVISSIIYSNGVRKMSYARGIMEMATKLATSLAEVVYLGGDGDQLPENLRKEVERKIALMQRTKAGDEQQKNPPAAQTKARLNLQSAEYSGVMHIFVRDKVKKERPVMTYKYKGTDVYFEYDEAGDVVRLSGDTKKQLLNVLGGGEERNFKKYELVI